MRTLKRKRRTLLLLLLLGGSLRSVGLDEDIRVLRQAFRDLKVCIGMRRGWADVARENRVFISVSVLLFCGCVLFCRSRINAQKISDIEEFLKEGQK